MFEEGISPTTFRLCSMIKVSPNLDRLCWRVLVGIINNCMFKLCSVLIYSVFDLPDQ